MSKFFQAFLSGAFFTFLVDFFFFLGIKLHYIDFYNIDVYYNILFADHQNVYVYLLFTTIFGFLITYVGNMKLNFIVIGGSFLLSLTTAIEPIGHKVGTMLLQKNNVNYKTKKHSYIGDVLYDGRKQITFYDYEVKKILILNKKDLL